MIKMKHTLYSLFILFVIWGIVPSNSTLANQHVTIEGGEIVNGRTLVPLRVIFEELDAEVKWDAKTQTVHATRGKTNMSLKIGSTQTTLNGKTVRIDTPAMIKQGRTYVPLRFVSESLGAEVKWDSVQNKALISLDDKKIEVLVGKLHYSNLNYSVFIPASIMDHIIIKEEKNDTTFYYKDQTFLKREVYLMNISRVKNFEEGSNEILLKYDQQNKYYYVIVLAGESIYLDYSDSSNKAMRVEESKYLDTFTILDESITNSFKLETSSR